eukprot:TRINITY_DN4545_c0_g1_i1.p1 TRINITY_DN4545_c0_g1~~TRINITY_DN4545_c0_g1_i1.p1  ORF type:complete len:214 (-),score=24.30 TRINITY_DN4545_c0_g1_i1:53-694(-)
MDSTTKRRSKSFSDRLKSVFKSKKYHDITQKLEQPVEELDGCTRFVVKQALRKGFGEERLLAVSEEGLKVMHPFTEEVVTSIPLGAIRTWRVYGKEGDAIIFNCNLEGNVVPVKFATANQGNQISDAMHIYIGRALKRTNLSPIVSRIYSQGSSSYMIEEPKESKDLEFHETATSRAISRTSSALSDRSSANSFSDLPNRRNTVEWDFRPNLL